MAKFQDVLAPYLTFEEVLSDGSTLTNPAADHRRVFLGEDGELHKKDSAGTVTDFAGTGIAATLADAAGDLLVASGADAWGKLAKGANGTLLGVNGSGNVAYVGGPLAYSGGPITSPVTMTNSATWYASGATVTIGAGTYLLWGQAIVRIANAGATSVMARLIDTEGSPVTYTGGQISMPANAGQEVPVVIRPHLVTLAGTRTINLECQDGFRALSVIVDTGTSVSPGTDIVTGFVALRVTAG
jgi:hypothetical protein